MELNEQKARDLWHDKMAGDISEEHEMALMAYLVTQPKLLKELNDLEHTWQLIEEIERPQPSNEMDARFEGMMQAYVTNAKIEHPNVLDWIVDQMTRSWQVGLASLLMGLFIGWWMLPSQNQQQDIVRLSEEIQDMKQVMLLTLIEQPKAQERIRAVNMAADLPDADEKVITALVTTLTSDENVNVRLAALESLIRYIELPEVRKAIVDALSEQDSPLLLVAIADVLVQIQEKSSVETMEEIKNKTDDELVKEKLEQSIQTLRKS